MQFPGTDVRDKLHRRIFSSWGVVSRNTSSCDKPIHIQTLDKLPIPPEIEDALARVEETGLTMRGDLLRSALEVYQYRAQLLAGFFYLWDPLPPQEWLTARFVYNDFVRSKLENVEPGVYADSPRLVAETYHDDPAVRNWTRIKPTFDTTKNRKVQWLSRYMADDIRKRLDPPTLVWVDFRESGKVLADALGIPYYGGGTDASAGLMRETGNRSVAVSVPAHHVGKNLQHAFSRNLILSMPSSADRVEQLIGRTHRYGQKNDVYVNVYTHAPDLQNSFRIAVETSKFQCELEKCERKLLLALEQKDKKK